MLKKSFEILLRFFTVSIFIILNQALFFIRTDDVMFLYIAEGIVALDLLIFIMLKVYLSSQKGDISAVKVKKIEPINHEVINPSLPLFIFSIIVVDYPALIVFLITLLFIIIARRGQMYFNPILILFGFNYFKVFTENDRSFEILSSQSYIETGSEIEVKQFNRFVYFHHIKK